MVVMSGFLARMVLTVLTLVPTMMSLVMIVWATFPMPFQLVTVLRTVLQSARCGPWVAPSGLEGRLEVLPSAAVLGPVGLTQDIGSVLVGDSSLGDVRRFRMLSKS